MEPVPPADTVSPGDALDYAIGVLAYCFGVFLVASVPYLVGFVVVAGPAGTGGGPLVFALLRIAAYAIVVAGMGGLLYKVVADAVAAAHRESPAEDESFADETA